MVEHPGTDYCGPGFWPTAPEPVAADAEPDLYQAFSYAILAQHRPVQLAGVEACSCGALRAECPVTSLASDLFTGSRLAAPERRPRPA